MRYKAFGKTGLEVSELCLGTWGIGGAGWDQNPEETKMDAIRASFEQGVNIFDTAPAYNAGAAERILGETLEKMGVRKDVILSTKCGNDFVNGQYVHCGKRDTSSHSATRRFETSGPTISTCTSCIGRRTMRHRRRRSGQ